MRGCSLSGEEQRGGEPHELAPRQRSGSETPFVWYVALSNLRPLGPLFSYQKLDPLQKLVWGMFKKCFQNARSPALLPFLPSAFCNPLS